MTVTDPAVIRLADSEKIPFGPISFYQPILNGAAGDYPVFTGIQTAEPGYETEPHSHPYVEVLHVLEGAAEAWLVGKEDEKTLLNAGDTIALPPDQPHIFRVAGDQTLRLLGTHLSNQRVVNFTDGNQQVFT
jgi:mannose-6-phosphate isomerase-like protein (cupin superfamily)